MKMRKLFFLSVLFLATFSVFLTFIPDVSFAISADDPELLAREAEQIEKYKENVKREGDTLLLKNKSGTYISLKDSPKCENYETCFAFKFIDYFMDAGFYVIENYYYEGGEVMMVSENNEKKYFIHELPMLSPDKKHIVTIPNNLDTGDGESGVFIWRFDGGKLIQEFSYRPIEYYVFENLKWKSNSHIELKEWLRSSKGLCPETDFMTIPVSLKLDDGDWKLYKDFSSDSVDCDVN